MFVRYNYILSPPNRQSYMKKSAVKTALFRGTYREAKGEEGLSLCLFNYKPFDFAMSTVYRNEFEKSEDFFRFYSFCIDICITICYNIGNEQKQLYEKEK